MSLPVKVLAIGSGGLHRALPHAMIDELNRTESYGGGIFVGQPRGTSTAQAFNDEDGRYHLVTFNPQGVTQVKKVNSVVGATTLSTEEGRGLFYRQTQVDLDLILVGVTEKGIARGEIGMEVLFNTLGSYYSAHGSSSVIQVADTDNLRGNAHAIRNLMIGYAQQGANPGFNRWLAENVDFLETMVDRIVPNPSAVPQIIKDQAKAMTPGITPSGERLFTYTEAMPPMWALVIQDTNKRLRVPFEAIGSPQVIVTPDSIDPYHNWKLRLANSVHVPGITHLLGVSYGNDKTIDQALREDPKLMAHLGAFARGNAYVVERDVPIPGFSAVDYTLAFVTRVANLADNPGRININHTLKLRERIANSVTSENYALSSEDFKRRLAFNFAVVLRYMTSVRNDGAEYTGKDDLGREYRFTDPNPTIPAALLNKFGSSYDVAKAAVYSILSNDKLWTPQGSSPVRLSDNSDFADRASAFYHRLVNGAKAVEVMRGL